MAHAWDTEQKAMLKDFWHNQGRFIAWAIVVGAFLGWGWHMWQQHVLHRNEQASNSYEMLQLAVAAHDTKRVSALALYLQTQYADTPYAGAGMLVQARNLVASGAFPEAKKALEWVSGHSKKMPAFQQVARLEL